jgi:hypothetical protein
LGEVDLPIQGIGWELHIVRRTEHARASDGKRRTVGKYAVYHDGVLQPGTDFSGTVAETRGPGRNQPENNGRRVEPGRYPLWTQNGDRYKTFGYVDSNSTGVSPKPGIELHNTGQRTEILIHPGDGFLSSVGCINLCKSLPNAAEPIDYIPSRRRVISVIGDMKAYLGASFPTVNGREIPRAFCVIDGDPVFHG